MLDGPPDAAEIVQAAAAFGLRAELPAQQQVCEVWAAHWPAVRLFAAMQTQWLWNMAGRTGLDYAALPVVERRIGIGARTARRAFGDLQVMEAEALRWFAQRTAG